MAYIALVAMARKRKYLAHNCPTPPHPPSVSLPQGLAIHLQDRLTQSVVQAMIDEAVAAIDEETVRKIHAIMDHTHVVEHAERVR